MAILQFMKRFSLNSKDKGGWVNISQPAKDNNSWFFPWDTYAKIKIEMSIYRLHQRYNYVIKVMSSGMYRSSVYDATSIIQTHSIETIPVLLFYGLRFILYSILGHRSYHILPPPWLLGG